MAKTVSQVIAKALKCYEVPFVAGIPGHGNWSMTDAFHNSEDAPRFVQVMHEQSAADMADVCFRLTGKPGAITASVGPGAANTLMGLATAYADSSACLALTGAVATHMRGHGVMQSLDRKFAPDFPRVAEAATKATFEIHTADAAASVLHRSFNAMLTGRPGPVGIDVPMDVQVASTDIDVCDLGQRMPMGAPRPDAEAVESALALLRSAERPVVVLGGGVLSARATSELRAFLELAYLPAVHTWNGKGALVDDHPLNIGPIGVGGSKAANDLTASADVLLALGCRFSDWSSSSFRKGVTFSIPDSKLIHIDIDPQTIGRSYPADIGIVADLGKALQDLHAGVSKKDSQDALERRASWLDKIAARKKDWAATLAHRINAEGMPASMLAVFQRLRQTLPCEAVITVGSGHCQAAVRQGFPCLEPHTHVTSGGYSTMGFAVPAAMASAIVRPGTPAVAIVGDGDFLMSAQELATCVMQGLPVIILVLNNSGYISIRDGQNAIFGRSVASEFPPMGAERGG
ncbi:MAG: thiamine pyrophosphate-binding protein, partial [Pseudomonadota bacterium]